MNLIDQQQSRVFLVILTIYFIWHISDSGSWGVLDNVDLLIHETGHLLFPSFLFGKFLNILAGSFFQVLVPLIFVWYFYVRDDIFSASVLMFWVGQSLANVSVYAGDAVKQLLPLIGGESVIHDWHYILSTLGLLNFTSSVALFFYFLAWLCVIVGIIAGFNSVSAPSKRM